MKIADIVKAGHGTAGHGGSWRVDKLDSDPFRGNEYLLSHYGHPMLKWRKSHRNDTEILDYWTGYGSVSDQGGMNQAFKSLGIDLYYSRKGGAGIR